MQLELYKKDTCPFCKRVLRAIEASGRTDVVLRDTRNDPANQEYLIEHGGMDQVPCLFIDGKPLYESADIIAWLEAHPQDAKEEGVKKAAGKISSILHRSPKQKGGSW